MTTLATFWLYRFCNEIWPPQDHKQSLISIQGKTNALSSFDKCSRGAFGHSKAKQRRRNRRNRNPNNIRWNCRSKVKEMKEFLDMKEGLNKKSRMKCIYLSSPKKSDFPRNLPAYRCRAYLHVTTIIIILCILYENFDF